MGLMQLKDNITATVQFTPIPEYQAPDDQNRLLKYAIDGALTIIKPYKKHLYFIPLNNVSSSDATQIIAWWQSLSALLFYPDLTNTPDTYYTVNIVNSQAPLNNMFPFETIYEGTLEIREN